MYRLPKVIQTAVHCTTAWRHLNPFTAVLTSGARHELSKPRVPLWWAPLVIQVIAYWLCVALQALISWRNLGT